MASTERAIGSLSSSRAVKVAPLLAELMSIRLRRPLACTDCTPVGANTASTPWPASTSMLVVAPCVLPLTSVAL
ncbi:hypothetical protein [Duganella sp. P38]|uniref:hypothetical protein n=1 Tax=Duganella sp. P38 TaxID=3423949 RepID=UPI003D7B5E58